MTSQVALFAALTAASILAAAAPLLLHPLPLTHALSGHQQRAYTTCRPGQSPTMLDTVT
jgi:hypothetical protein